MRHCECLKPRINRKYQHVLTVHPDDQDRQSPAWLALLQLIEQAVADGREVFDPGRELGSELWQQISVLPTQIGQLKQVKHLQLYGSQLTRIPAQIGEMTALEEFTPYGSYRLHWFPYEITRCKNLISSTISTRSLYGNKRHRTAFPKLRGNPIDFVEPVFCSVCGAPSPERGLNQVWTSMRVGTDVLPLLAHTCSKECIEKIPNGAPSYQPRPHKGGQVAKKPNPDLVLNF